MIEGRRTSAFLEEEQACGDGAFSLPGLCLKADKDPLAFHTVTLSLAGIYWLSFTCRLTGLEHLNCQQTVGSHYLSIFKNSVFFSDKKYCKLLTATLNTYFNENGLFNVSNIFFCHFSDEGCI